MDVYRIGTLLEMVREMAYQLAVDGKLVKVCVQQSMGQGVFQVCLLIQVCILTVLTVGPEYITRYHQPSASREWHSAAQRSTAQHSTVQHSTAQHSTGQGLLQYHCSVYEENSPYSA